MGKFKGRRPSPTMIVAGVALIVALAGTAIAAPTAIKSVLDKKEKKQVKNIANKRITKRAPNLSVASAKTAANADNATTAGNGYLGYARISVTGTVSQAKNITNANVTHPTNGAFCFNNLPFNPQNIQADPDANGSLGEVAVETPGAGDCANTQAGVFTFNVGTQTRNDRPFYVLFN
jgi:hypothetical protein